MQEVTLFGVRIDALLPEEAVERALNGENGQVFAVTPNMLMLEACRRDASLRALLGSAELSLADGVGVLRMARRQGRPLPARIAGIDFGEAVLAEAERRGLRVFLLGGREGVALHAAERLHARYPNLRIRGTQHGYFSKTGSENERVLEEIRRSKAEILFVCLGFPLQEKWIAAHRKELPGVRLLAGLGGSLDVWAGRVRRAPYPLRAAGLEWAWRMAREPRRLRELPRLLRGALRR